jgi:hypothetical protein
MTKRLHLISACASRLEGTYAEAIADTQVAADPPIDDLDAQLLLVRALSLEDRDDDEGSEIDRILTVLSSSEAGRACPLTLALQARRAAERHIGSRGEIVFSRDPVDLVLRSLDLRRAASGIVEQTIPGNRDEVTEFFRGFVALGVPVTPSWLLDVFGYALLVAGCAEEGRVFLQRCISLDPAYSYGYLHLGDYFLFRRTEPNDGREKAHPGHPGAWHARACYLLAVRVERSRASRVRRIARDRLRLVDALESSRG